MNPQRSFGIALAGVGLLVALAVVWVHWRRPTVTAHNNLGSAATVQLCPGQDCNGPLFRLPAGGSKTIALGDRLGDRSDMLRVEADGLLLGCVPVIRIDLPRHQRVDLSLPTSATARCS